MKSSDEILEFILKYRRGKAYFNWTALEIKGHILESIDNGEIGIVVNNECEIVGVITITKLHKTKVIYVDNILAKPGWSVLKTFLELKSKILPGWSVRGNRHGKLMQYPKFQKC